MQRPSLGFVGTIAGNRPTRGIERKRLLLASLKQSDQVHVEPIGDRGAIIRQPHAAPISRVVRDDLLQQQHQCFRRRHVWRVAGVDLMVTRAGLALPDERSELSPYRRTNNL